MFLSENATLFQVSPLLSPANHWVPGWQSPLSNIFETGSLPLGFQHKQKCLFGKGIQNTVIWNAHKDQCNVIVLHNWKLNIIFFKKMHWQLAQRISNHFQIYETFKVEQHQLSHLNLLRRTPEWTIFEDISHSFEECSIWKGPPTVRHLCCYLTCCWNFIVWYFLLWGEKK